MSTIIKDSCVVLPGARRKGHRQWFLHMANVLGFVAQNKVSRHKPVEARVDHGRWIADCPDCKGAECVTPDDPTFMCLSCGNKFVDGKFRKVKFPAPAKLKKIEALLDRRPLHAQNWLPGESLNQLREENAKNLAGG